MFTFGPAGPLIPGSPMGPCLPISPGIPGIPAGPWSPCFPDGPCGPCIPGRPGSQPQSPEPSYKTNQIHCNLTYKYDNANYKRKSYFITYIDSCRKIYFPQF